MKRERPGSSRVDLDWSAQTMLPIEINGREHRLEAHAYQGREAAMQALVLVNPAATGDGAGAGAGAGGKAAEGTSRLPLVRVHSGCVTGDIFHSLRCDCYQQLQAALGRILAEPPGVLVYLPYQEGRGIGLMNKIRAYAAQDQGLDTVDANVAVGSPVEARAWDFAADILIDLGFKEIRLLTNNPLKVEGLAAEGIQIVERLPLVVASSPYNERYLETKRDRLSHEL